MPLAVNSDLLPEERLPLGLKTVRLAEAKEGGFLISDGEALFEARMASSCLLVPEKGDLVLAYFDREKVYITAVLERTLTKKAALNLPDRVVIESADLGFKTKHFSVDTQKIQFKADQVSLFGRLLKLDFRIVHCLAGLVSSVCRSFLGTSHNLTLKVDGAAKVSGQSIRITAQEDLMARAEGLDLKASGSVKIDGRDLRLG
ncbi:MAG: DUF3540 domain-containing protein [Deltaproteobacteria bacterium]|jgi:hypothetical protein|nr:DUF3540 domain-containing protein [Deltaproteobacteria bacterium]